MNCKINIFAIDLNACNPNHFYFLEQNTNLIIDGTFSKMVYTAESFTINSIYILVRFENGIHFNKLRQLERQILSQYMNHTNTTKETILGLNNLLISKKNKIVSHPKKLLKISGVWENDTQFGLTFRWIDGFQL